MKEERKERSWRRKRAGIWLRIYEPFVFDLIKIV
jgi:hypothetical protein